MKLTIIATKPDGNHQRELLAAAQARGVSASISNLTRDDLHAGRLASKLKGAVIWRSSDLDVNSERSSLLPLLKKKTVASDGVFHYPMIRFKYYQQQILSLEKGTAAWSIPTYRFKTLAKLRESIASKELRLPVIAKPNAGAHGKGIIILQNAEDVESITKPLDYVFQGYIPNDCDWRVIVVGGTALGFLRRQAADGSFLNNISQGASATVETDQALCSELAKIATKVASLFHLAFCGVDIIRDRETGKLYVLEVNSAPQWRDEFGFKNVTKVDVPAKVIDWVIARETASKHSLPKNVEQYYKDRFDNLYGDAFHFASRLWLWTHDEWARERLDEKQAEFIGTMPEEIDATIRGMIERAKNKPLSVNQNKTYRKGAFAAHPELPLYNSLLFKTVFCDSVYGLDIRPYIRKYVSDKDFLAVFERLVNDHNAVRLLSTHAVNHFYLLKNYFKGTLSLSSSVLVSPYELLELLPGYQDLEDAGIINRQTSIKLQIYLLTHAIIGESRFYARAVKGTAFRTLCQKLERLISDNYFEVSLDNKFEFLVCAAICGYDTNLRSQIHQEAEKSVSWAGNFVVDSCNSVADSEVRHCLRTSEHRNVLYIMSSRQFTQRDEKVSKVKVAGVTNVRPIGRLAHVRIPSYGIRRMVARVDSGATRSAIAATNIYVDDKGLHFTLFNPESHMYTGREYIVNDYKQITVKNTATYQDRFAIPVEIEVNNETYKIMITLADRAHMLYPVLLGRNFLTGNYTVDTSKQFVRAERRLMER